MILDSLLVFRSSDQVCRMLPAILAASGIRVESESGRFTQTGFVASAAATIGSWFGEEVEIRLHPDDGGTSVVKIRSDHKGPSFFKDVDNVVRVRQSFKRTMKSLGVTVAWVRSTLG